METELKQTIQGLYLALFAHTLGKITCKLLANNVIAIVLEEATVRPEQMLLSGGRHETARAFRRQLNEIFLNHLKIIFSENYHYPVVDVLSQYQEDTGHMSLMVLGKSDD